jgi:hypothetical protein
MKKSVIFIWLFEIKVYFTIMNQTYKKIAPNLPTMRYHFNSDNYLTLCDYGLIDFLYRNFL